LLLIALLLCKLDPLIDFVKFTPLTQLAFMMGKVIINSTLPLR